MHTRRIALMAGVAGMVGLVAAALAFRAPGAAPAASPLTASAPAVAAAQGVQIELDPDTLVGWGLGPTQPIFFSHRRHAGVFEIDCQYCHSNTDKSPVALVPPVEVCVGCHRVVKAASPEIQKLRGFEARGESIPWERIYKLADFVQFNHGRHVRAGLDCQECHGKVEETDVLYQWAPLTMGWCLQCHRQPGDDEAKLEKAARNAEKFGEPGREEHSLYPKSIDSRYGVTKGPIDCAACHY
jgi:hypothetical protein